MMDEVSSSGSGKPKSGWRPSELAFHVYSPGIRSSVDEKPQSLRVVVRKPLVARLTRDIVETYKTCNPQFHYSEELNLKRYLTSPSIGVLNDGYDNANSDLILAVNFALVNLDSQRRYIVKDMLGQGTFGQVAKCWTAEAKGFVAVKVIKNQPAYYQQALVEVSILTTLNRKYDPEDKHHIVRIYDYFVYQRHLCIVFELLDSNLYELLKLNEYRGLSLNIVQVFSKQILCGLALMKDAGIIHCDLKPENILLRTGLKPAEIKIIDFGSACMEDRTVYSYIQSRYYRSPEVLLGYQYCTAIDMWSFGCIVAELFLGLPLFPGASEFDLLRRMIKILGGQPPDYVLKEAKNTNKFFKCVGDNTQEDTGQIPVSRQSAYQTLAEEEYEARELKKPTIGKEYFNHMNLEAIITKYPYRKNLSEEDMRKESRERLSLIDFLRGLVEFDPEKRWSPLQASKHPFVTGELFTSPYRPAPETPHLPVSQIVGVDHHPGGGHWFPSGLSPNIAGGNRIAMQNSSHYQMVQYAHAGSYGSLGSHGSSYGSYGDNNNMVAFFSPAGPSGMNIYTQGGVPIFGASPDARRRMIQLPHGNGLGVSPAGNFAPMSLGTSPSQFTPPGSYGQVSSGSPGHYGPTSPARSNSHGSPLGKVAAVGQFNRRKNWGYPGSLQSQESSSSPSSHHWHGQGQYGDASSVPNQSEAGSWRQKQGGIGKTSGYSTSHNVSSLPTLGSSNQFQHIHKGASSHDNKPETSILQPDPGDWDPNYSDDLLLQEDGLNVASLTNDISNGMHLAQSLVPQDPLTGGRRFNRVSNTSSNITMQSRSNVPIQQFSHEELGSPPEYDMYGGYSHPMQKPSHFIPHFQYNYPSRLGQQQQQPGQRFHHGRSTAIRGSEWNHMNVQQPPVSGFNSGGPRSPGSSGTPWGRRGNHPLASMPPTPRGRKDYGRIV